MSMLFCFHDRDHVRRSHFLNNFLHGGQGRGVNHEAVSIKGGLLAVVGEAVLKLGLDVLIEQAATNSR